MYASRWKIEKVSIEGMEGVHNSNHANNTTTARPPTQTSLPSAKTTHQPYNPTPNNLAHHNSRLNALTPTTTVTIPHTTMTHANKILIAATLNTNITTSTKSNKTSSTLPLTTSYRRMTPPSMTNLNVTTQTPQSTLIQTNKRIFISREYSPCATYFTAEQYHWHIFSLRDPPSPFTTFVHATHFPSQIRTTLAST